jgi:hypothetical protein
VSKAPPKAIHGHSVDCIRFVTDAGLDKAQTIVHVMVMKKGKDYSDAYSEKY